MQNRRDSYPVNALIFELQPELTRFFTNDQWSFFHFLFRFLFVSFSCFPSYLSFGPNVMLFRLPSKWIQKWYLSPTHLQNLSKEAFSLFATHRDNKIKAILKSPNKISQIPTLNVSSGTNSFVYVAAGTIKYVLIQCHFKISTNLCGISWRQCELHNFLRRQLKSAVLSWV